MAKTILTLNLCFYFMGDLKDEIYAFAWDVFKIVKETWDENLTDPERGKKHDDFLNKRWELYQKLEKLPGKTDNITYDDTAAFFYEVESRTKIPYKQINYEQFKKYVDDYLLGTPFEFEFCFRITTHNIFPTGYKLGHGQIFPFADLPKQIQQSVERFMGSDFHDDEEYQQTREKYIEYRKNNDNYFYLKINALYRQSATIKAISLSNRSSNILKFVNGFKRFSIYGDEPLSHFNYYYYSEHFKTCGSSRGAKFEGLPVHRWDILDYQTNAISEMMLNPKPTDLEKRILNVIDVYGMIDDSTPLHMSFILCIIALEGLLLHDGEKDYLGWKLAEKISFLLGDSIPWLIISYNKQRDEITSEFITLNRLDARKKLFAKISELYNKCSRFAHNGLDPDKDKDRISAKDYNHAFQILRWTVEKLIDLRKDGMESINKQPEKPNQSLDEFIATLKFQ